MNTKKNIIWIIVAVIVIIGIYYFVKSSSNSVTVTNNQNVSTTTIPVGTATTTQNKPSEVIGQSAGGRDITAYHYGTGTDEILFIGGIHGSYDANTITLANDLMNYLKANPGVIPANEKVTVIPALNMDGYKGDTGRFNANNVDLNRNFDCDWQANAVWQDKAVSGGSAVFSEPESQAFKNYVTNNNPKAVVAYYSAAGGVFASNCHTGILPETSKLVKAYAQASGYPAYQSFDFYATTGDLTNWLAKINVPAVSILLTNHTSTEWTKNLAGIQAMLEYYGK